MQRILWYTLTTILAVFFSGGCSKPPLPPQSVKAEVTGGLKQSLTPHGFTQTEITTEDIVVTWDRVEGADSYTIYWANAPGVSKTNGTAIINAVSPYKHTDLVESMPYYYVVTATSKVGESKESKEVFATPRHGKMVFRY